MTHQHAGYPHEPATPGPYPAQGGFPPPTPPGRSSSSKTVLIIAACVALVAALGSAALLVFAFNDDEDTAQGGDQASQDTDEPTDNENTDTSDLTPLPVNYSTPQGFSQVSTAELITPLFPTYDVEFLAMDDADTYESVFVVSYVLDSDTTDYTDDQLVDEVASYAGTLGKLNSDQPAPVDVGDKTWIFDYIQQEGLSGNVINYEAYFFFSGPYLIEVGCQPDKETAAVIEACGSVLGTISW